MEKYVVLTCNCLATRKDACKTEYVNFFIQIPNKENAILLRKVSFVRKNVNTPQLERNGSTIFAAKIRTAKEKREKRRFARKCPETSVRRLRNALCFT